ncbi:MAG: hypothetical protein CMM52_15115 [Rhodospirillaceae bacterium]|nr:hypothetical protein [Rhodospirillaceae bacterium]|tara:strand:- start:24012 stop:25154 length:1143 start_codon:yes stop_codon:yes gene_type:complete
MTLDETEISEWTVDAVLHYARLKAAENRRVFESVESEILGGMSTLLTDRDRACVMQMLKELIFEVVSAIQNQLPVATDTHDLEDETLKSLSINRSMEVFECLFSNRPLCGSALIEEAVMQLCITSAEQIVKRGGDKLRLRGSDPEQDLLALLPGLPPNSSIRHRVQNVQPSDTGRRDPFNNPVLYLKELNPQMRFSLVWRVAAAFEWCLARHTDDVITSVDTALEQAAANLLENTDSGGPGVSALVETELHDVESIDPRTYAAILRTGDFKMFEALIAHATGIEVALIRRLLFEDGGVGVLVLSKVLNLDESDIEFISDVATAASGHIFTPNSAEARTVLGPRNGISTDSANKVCAYWKRGTQYQRAIWEVRSAHNPLAM